MASKKLERINEDIRLALSEILRDVKDPRVQQGMLSVTAAEATGDLKYCTVYVSVYGMTSEKEFLRGIKSASGWLRRELGMRLSLRNTPELLFKVDHSLERGAHISELIAGLDLAEEENHDEA